MTNSSYKVGEPDTGTADPNRHSDYVYDSIGNRSSQPLVDKIYVSNDLNQYLNTQTLGTDGYPDLGISYQYDLDGNLVASQLLGDMNCDGAVNAYDIDPFALAMTDPAQYIIDFPNCAATIGDINGSGIVDGFDIDAFVSLVLYPSSNASAAIAYGYDAENRMISVEPIYPEIGSQKVEYDYDYRGRRIGKRVYGWSGTAWNTTESSHTKYVYDGWRVVLELDGMNSDFVSRKFTWGPDLSGSLEGAGGIGGLLAIEDVDDPSDGSDPYGKFLVCYDGNGNVTQLLDWEAAYAGGTWDDAYIVAHYEYDPYGRLMRYGGDYWADNPVRFSTKWFDNETGLGYWGYRYYSPDLGRWITRDPLDEEGGLNIYSYVVNHPKSFIDMIGMQAVQPGLPHLESPFVAGGTFSMTAYWSYDTVHGLDFWDRPPVPTRMEFVLEFTWACIECEGVTFGKPSIKYKQTPPQLIDGVSFKGIGISYKNYVDMTYKKWPGKCEEGVCGDVDILEFFVTWRSRTGFAVSPGHGDFGAELPDIFNTRRIAQKTFEVVIDCCEGGYDANIDWSTAESKFYKENMPRSAHDFQHGFGWKIGNEEDTPQWKSR